MSGTWTRRVTTVFVSLSLLLQLAAVFSPGWLIDIQANYEEHDSMFYKMKCVTLPEDDCEFESMRSLYMKARTRIENAGMAKIGLAQIDYSYHRQVLKQILVIISLFVTFIVWVAQIYRRCYEDRKYHRLITRSAVLGTFPTGIMISIICQDFVHIDNMMELRSFDDDRDHTYIGFPYSLAMYIGSVVFLAGGVLMLMNQSAGPAKERPKAKVISYDDDDYAVSRPAIKAEFIPISEDTSTRYVVTPTKEKPVSTICYSEKL